MPGAARGTHPAWRSGGDSLLTAPREILDFWFKTVGPQRWYAVDPKLDADIGARFESAWRDAKDGRFDDWVSSREGALALVLLLDQFPRNMFRGKADAFATDAKARDVAGQAIDRRFDIEAPTAARNFFYLPFMHSEDVGDQDRAVALIERRIGKDSEPHVFAKMHREVIARFGRFPRRNAALGRATTPEEQAYMDGGGKF